MTVCPAAFDAEFILSIAEGAHGLAECPPVRPAGGKRPGGKGYDPATSDRLCQTGTRLQRRPGTSEDETACEPPITHSMTSSARASSDCGTVSPSDFAVFILITSSNLVGSATGRSAGLAPLRILPA
jgi:hypothetical protein